MIKKRDFVNIINMALFSGKYILSLSKQQQSEGTVSQRKNETPLFFSIPIIVQK